MALYTSSKSVVQREEYDTHVRDVLKQLDDLTRTPFTIAVEKGPLNNAVTFATLPQPSYRKKWSGQQNNEIEVLEQCILSLDNEVPQMDEGNNCSKAVPEHILANNSPYALLGGMRDTEGENILPSSKHQVVVFIVADQPELHEIIGRGSQKCNNRCSVCPCPRDHMGCTCEITDNCLCETECQLFNTQDLVQWGKESQKLHYLKRLKATCVKKRKEQEKKIPQNQRLINT